MALEYVTVGLDARHKRALDEMCERRGASKTAVMREAIRILSMVENMAMQGKTLTWTQEDGAQGLLLAEMTAAEARFPLPEPGVSVSPMEAHPAIVLSADRRQAERWAKDNGLRPSEWLWPSSPYVVMGLDFRLHALHALPGWHESDDMRKAWDYIARHPTYAAKMMSDFTPEERASGQHVQAGVPTADDARADAGRGDEEQGGLADGGAQGAEARSGE